MTLWSRFVYPVAESSLLPHWVCSQELSRSMRTHQIGTPRLSEASSLSLIHQPNFKCRVAGQSAFLFRHNCCSSNRCCFEKSSWSSFIIRQQIAVGNVDAIQGFSYD